MRLKLPTLSVSLWQFSNCLSLICLSLTWLSWCSSTLWPGKNLLSQLHKKLPMLGYWWNCGRVKDCSNLCLTKSCLFISWISLPLCFRDVLAVCLHIPRWIYSVTDTNKERLSQLEPSASGPSWAFAFQNLQQNNTKPQINTLCWGALSLISLLQKLGFPHHLINRLMKCPKGNQAEWCAPYRYVAYLRVCRFLWGRGRDLRGNGFFTSFSG